MWWDVVKRVRWGNVALAAAVLVVLVGVVVGPLIGPSLPALPPDRMVPLLVEDTPPPLVADPGTVPHEGKTARPQATRQRKRESRAETRPARRPAKRSKRRDTTDATPRRPAPTVTRRAAPPRATRAPALPPRPRPPAPRDTTGEFNFEGG